MKTQYSAVILAHRQELSDPQPILQEALFHSIKTKHCPKNCIGRIEFLFCKWKCVSWLLNGTTEKSSWCLHHSTRFQLML